MSPVAVRRGHSQVIDIAPVAVRRRGSVAVRRGYSQVLEIPTVAVAVAVRAQTPHTPQAARTPSEGAAAATTNCSARKEDHDRDHHNQRPRDGQDVRVRRADDGRHPAGCLAWPNLGRQDPGGFRDRGRFRIRNAHGGHRSRVDCRRERPPGLPREESAGRVSARPVADHDSGCDAGAGWGRDYGQRFWWRREVRTMNLMRIAARILRPIVVQILADEERRHRAKMRAAADRISAELNLEGQPNSLSQLSLKVLRGDSQ